jgi:Ca2+-binding RTX toxin-like protein
MNSFSARLAGGALAAALLAVTAAQANAAPSIKVKHKTLTVKGSGKSDKLTLRLHSGAPDTLDVDVGDDGSADFSVARNRVARIRVNARGGDDQVRIDDANGAFTTTIPTTIDGGSGKDTLLGGAGAEKLLGGRGADLVDGNGGNDTADLGAGDDRFVWDPGDGSDVVDGRRGRDAMTFNGNDANESFELSANGTRARFFRSVGGITMDLDGVEQVDLAAKGGADNLQVDDLAATDVRTVNSDLATDGAADKVTVNATNGDDAITASGGAGSATVTGLAATLNITGAEPANDALTINALGGTDRIAAGTLAATALQLTEDGGADNDTLLGSAGVDRQLGGDGNDAIDGKQGNDLALMGAGDDVFTWDPGDGSDIVEGQDGSDAMTSTAAATTSCSRRRPTASACASPATSATS